MKIGGPKIGIRPLPKIRLERLKIPKFKTGRTGIKLKFVK